MAARRKPVRKRRRPKKRWIKLNRTNHLKTMIVFLAIVVSLAALMGNLVYIEHTSGAKYSKIVLSQRTYDSAPIPYRRGDILDRQGIVLATSLDVYNVILDCSVVTAKEQYLESTMQALLASFPELSETEVRTFIKENPKNRYKVLTKHVSYEQMQGFLARQRGEGQTGQEKAEGQKDKKDDEDKKAAAADKIKGIWFEKEYVRSYPYKSLASSVIGFTASGNVGMAGIENSYDSVLNGTNGRQYGYLNSDNSLERTIKEAVDGNNVISTLDMNIQSVVEQKILEFNKAYKNQAREGDGAENIGVVIQNPNTGSIIAMANYPNFDLSNPRSLEGRYTKEEIEAMSEEETTDALNKLWRNFCISDTFEPGSTQKPLTIAAGLDCGRLNETDTFVCDGIEEVADKKLRCVSRSGHGLETLQGALMDSCNDTLMQIVRKMGKEEFCRYQSIFGMGRKTNIDLPGEARTDTLVRTVEQTNSVDLASSSFGQNFNCTMIQMISAFSSLINGGNYYKPHIVSKITDQNGNTVEEIKPELLKQTISKETSDQIKEYLYEVVNKGSASVAKVPGYSMGGKTGTAEKQPRRNGNYLVSFIGYLPQEKPEYVIYVVIDTPNQSTEGEAQAHSTFAQNLAREILEEILPYMNIFKDEQIDEDAPKKKDTNMYTAIAGYESKAAQGEAVTYN